MRETASVDELLLAHPLAGSSLAMQDVRYAAQLLLRRKDSWERGVDDLLRLIAVLLVLYTEECLEHEQRAILGLGSGQFYSLLEKVVQKSAASMQLCLDDLIMAVAQVDTTSTTTRLMQASGQDLQALCCEGEGSTRLDRLPSAAQLGRLHQRLNRPKMDMHEPPPQVHLLTSQLKVVVIYCALLMRALEDEYEPWEKAFVAVTLCMLVGTLAWLERRSGLFSLPATPVFVRMCVLTLASS